MKSPIVGSLPNTRTHRALVTYLGQTVLKECSLGDLAPNYVRIKVEAVGLCRTDLRVISGELKTTRPLTPGHEFSGTIASVGTGIFDFQEDDRVVVNPWVSCGECEFCENGQSEVCQNSSMLGVHIDGALGEYATVPAHAVHKFSENLSFECAAFAEPVAASLAVLNAPLQSDERGLILGKSRIAELTKRILEAHGFTKLTMCEFEDCNRLQMHSFDFIIETESTSQIFRKMIELIKPRGKLVLKSRQLQPTSFTMMDILPKEPQMHVVHYGSFAKAIEMLSSGQVAVADLIGQTFSLEAFQDAIQAAQSNETQKVFLSPHGLPRK